MSRGWIGVDLDGTLAEYHGWDEGKIGKPIPLMKERVEKWLAEGQEVRIVTARVGPQRDDTARVGMKLHIQQWLMDNIEGVDVEHPMEVTHEKDFSMIELWDDRAVQIVKNTGKRVDEPFDLSHLLEAIALCDKEPKHYAEIHPHLMRQLTILAPVGSLYKTSDKTYIKTEKGWEIK